MTNVLEAVLFDMDGLLVDSEPLWFETEVEVMARLGAPWSKEDQEQLLGGSMAKTAAYLLSRAARPVSTQQVIRWMTDGMLKRAAEGRIEIQPGARELVAEVAASGIPYALVTSSEREFAAAVMTGTGFDFPIRVTGEDVERSKPAPDPYLLGARLLGARPERCVALEDSPTGVVSATAAGCRVVAVPSLVDIPAADGRLVVKSLADVSLATLHSLVA